MSRPEFDARDAEILASRVAEFDAIKGPRVGDYLRIGPDEYLRFTHDWDDAIQTTCKPTHPCHGDASFYLSADGHVSFSGSLDSAIDKVRLRDTGERRDASFWFFHHNWAQAHNGVHFKVPVRVYELDGDARLI